MTKSLDRDVIIDAWLQSGLQESLCFPFERLSLEITFSPSDSTIYRIAKRVFLKMLIHCKAIYPFCRCSSVCIYCLKNGIKLARSILYGFCGFKRYLRYMNETCLNLELTDLGIEVWYVHFAYIIADIVSFR